MILSHYSSQEIPDLFNKIYCSQEKWKPEGLWVSVENANRSWKEFCMENDYNIKGLTYEHSVDLKITSNFLILDTVSKINSFTEEYTIRWTDLEYTLIDWGRLSKERDGIIISPYQPSVAANISTFWYWGWDCASGCIWNLDSIASLRLREIFSLDALYQVEAEQPTGAYEWVQEDVMPYQWPENSI